jgi:hypothetical protein
MNMSGGQFLYVADRTNYKINFTNAPASFQLYLNDLPMDASVIFELEGLDKDRTNFSFSDEKDNTDITEVFAMTSLNSAITTSFFKDPISETFFIKFVAEMRHGFRFPQPKMTFENEQFGGVKVNVTLLETALSILENKLTTNVVLVHPNPTSNTFKIKLENNENEINNIQVISVSGAIVKEFKYNLDTQYDISNLSEGLYFLMFRNNETVIQSKKILKIK